MATTSRFHLPFMHWVQKWAPLWLGALFLLLTALARADEVAETELRPPQGTPFFLLTDASYASSEEARVRFEVGSENLYQLAEADGVEIALYKVERPLDFLRQQRNLHRIDLKAAARPEGLANTLSYLWDSWWQRARRMWQNLFDAKLRGAVTKEAPALKTPKDIGKPTDYVYQGAYRAMPGMQQVVRMRYPVQFARPIQPPEDLKLDGSSTNFIQPKDGNVYIPLGKQAPGLYVVEAAVGRQRAVTLLFVTDTVAVTKTAQNQFLVWAAQRATGLASAGAQVVWSDLNGVLGSGSTDAQGVWSTEHRVPETSYAFGQDKQGGVFISENFYYDSEIYNAKLYGYTDRPLYRPGDEVHIRLYGREFTSATQSTPLAGGPIKVTVFDATGAPVHQATVDYQGSTGAYTRFTLPDNAPSGGYEIRMARGEDEYTAAFRVAPYVKPHFDVQIEPGKASFKTGEELKGRIRLAYPDGRPVAKATLTLSARAQVLTMVDGDLAYGGQFPVQIDNNQALETDSDGVVNFKLPAVKEPSRVVLTVLASDGAAQRVRSTKDLMIERAATAWRLQPARQFAAANESVAWRMSLIEGSGNAPAHVPTRWVALHQESQTKVEGKLPAKANDFALQLARPGSYTIELRDDEDRLLGAAPFWVAGSELKPPQGAVEIVFDKARYRAGDKAKALITFPVPVGDALLTLERDKVEARGTLLGAPGLALLRKLSDRQWEAVVEVRAEHAPNITFSVAYVSGADFGFQNAGIVVEQPTLQVSVKPDRTAYLPGDTVTLDIQTTNPAGQGVSAVLSVGAVDDMVYVLQPELAPSVQDFFYHLRRNNVRTHSSLSFITYDEAADPRQLESLARQNNERGVKVLERPRRDERDTAYFAPAVTTDAQGRAKVSFTVPDALTRWRVTAKAYGQGSADGLVGERRAYFQSDKPFFARWTSSTWLRQGDQTQASVALFNQTDKDSEVQLNVTLGGQAIGSQKLTAHPGANHVVVPLPKAMQSGDVTLDVVQAGRVMDKLATRLNVEPVGWRSEQELLVPVVAGSSASSFKLPPDAGDVRVRLVGDGAAAWSRVADSLIDYPYGCVEQTASRLIPLALALQSLPGAEAAQHPLRQRLYGARLRLAAMAGPDAVFGWWGASMPDSAFMSAYAYHADHLATQTLGMSLPDEHWSRLLDIYSKAQGRDTLAQRAWALWLMNDMGLPTATMTLGLVESLEVELGRAGGKAANAGAKPGEGLYFGPLVAGADSDAMALVVASQLAQADKQPWPASLKAPLEAAYARLEASKALLPQAALVWTGRRPANGEALGAALASASQAQPTIDRTLALTLLAKASGPRPRQSVAGAQIKSGWLAVASSSGQTEWRPQAGNATVPNGDYGIDWTAPLPQAASLSVRYQSAQTPKGKLPATLKRQLFRLEAKDGVYTPVPLKPGEALRTDALYLDEVTVAAQTPLSHALVELGLPPGAMLETTTWGIQLPGEKAPVPLERATGEATRVGYVVPVDAVDAQGSRTFRHLLRVGQKGQFNVPAARVWRMYQPDAQALESGPAVQAWLVP